MDESANGSFYDGAWALQYLRSFAGTIAGGTSEIQRNIVAEHVLGLPGGEGPARMLAGPRPRRPDASDRRRRSSPTKG